MSIATPRSKREWSLVRRQSLVIGVTLTVLSILLGIGGSWFIRDVAEAMSDRLLSGSIKGIVETIGVDDGAVTLEIPPSAFGMLEDNAKDNVYYTVRQGGRVLTGYHDFPAGPSVPSEDVQFRYDQYLGQKVRVGAAFRYLPRMDQPVLVEVAETLGERNALARRMLTGLIALELTLVAVALLLIWPATRWGLRPVTRLQMRMKERPSTGIDFTPLPVDGVPPELLGLVGGFNSLLSQLDHSVQGMRRFTGDAAHQMRTPLAVLRTHIALLKDRPTATSIDDIDAAADRLQRLLTQLLMLARVEDPAFAKTSTSSSDARAGAREVCFRLGPEALDRQISLEFEGEGSFEINLDPVMLEELLSNLIDNAIRYNSSGGTVTVRVISSDRSRTIVIEDDGPGIPADAVTKVFDRFYRLERDQAKPGSGLGLPIASALTALAEGQLRLFQGKNGRGLIVELDFGNRPFEATGQL